MKCPNCGTENQQLNARVCIKCGAKIEPVQIMEQAAHMPPPAASRATDVPSGHPEASAPTADTNQAPTDQRPATPPKKSSGCCLPILLAVGGLAALLLVLLLLLGAFLFFFGIQRSESAIEVNRAEPTMAATTAPMAVATEPETPTMPNCEGWTYQAAVAYFEAIGCETVCEYVFDDAVPADTIITQTLPEGTPLDAQSVILFTVSKGADICPYAYSQKVTVTAPAGSTSAQLVLYAWENGNWVCKYTCAATVGRNGIGSNYGEGKGYTPMGTFKLGVALSQNRIGNTAWPIQYVTTDTCIVDDASSRLYNTIQSVSSLPSGVHYDPIGKTLVSGSTDVCLYIEHNGNGLTSDNVVAGKGSAITLCGKRNGYDPHTAGCVDISQANMHELLSLLDYTCNPHIEIAVQ